ncbi:hypothetical protein SAMN04487943_11129 [Gracilibacillus orientalis]|uniref:Lipoprotein n=1 Tax=Gracilibacillus orientalis TaxID=334253 RepID=A0A1I4PFP9_9BACI|nr:hypothetical protein [Gracilibacillus orientalis]SFM26223.1 hypothetical protein SAMN04487943_11129 [Gracilibacillus orientalis]
MKKLTIILCLNVAVFVLVGCASDTNEESSTDSSENSAALELTEKDTTETDKNTSTNEVEESDTNNVDNISSEETVNNDSDSTTSENSDSNAQDNKDTLAQYSSEQIEYARVWLQLGPNQEIDELNVRHISSGEPINPNDDTSASYPEDVIQLAGSRLVDGSVTYSGNGDGTINVYNVPLRWDSPADVDENFMQEYTEDISDNTEQVYVDPGDDEEIIQLIEVLHVH